MFIELTHSHMFGLVWKVLFNLQRVKRAGGKAETIQSPPPTYIIYYKTVNMISGMSQLFSDYITVFESSMTFPTSPAFIAQHISLNISLFVISGRQ